jgi:hypothetical protein
MGILKQFEAEAGRTSYQQERWHKKRLEERSRQWKRDIREERQAIITVEKAEEIMDARQRGLTWAEAGRLVGHANPGSAYQIVDRVFPGQAKLTVKKR